MEERTLFDYWMVLYRRKWIIASVVLSSAVVALFLSQIIPPVYESKAAFFVPQQPDIATFFAPDSPETIARTPLSPTPRGVAHAPYIGMLKSKALAMRVNQEFPMKRLQDLERNVDVELSNEFMLQVYVRDRDPKLAADIANAYFRYLNRSVQSFSDIPTLSNRQTIEAQLAETRQKLAISRKALEVFEAGTGIADLSQRTAELVRQLSSFEISLENVRVNLREVGTKVAGIQQQLAREASLYVSSELVTTDPTVESLKKDLSDLEAAIKGSLTDLTERHPEMLKLRAQYEAKRSELAQEVDRIIKSRTKQPGSFYEDLRRTLANLLVEKEASEAKLLGLQRGIAAIEAKLVTLPEVKAKHDELTTRVELHEKLVEMLLTDLEEAKIQGKRQMQAAILLDPAILPDSPVFPILWLNSVVAAGLGFLGSMFYCFLLDYIKRVQITRRIKESVASRVRIEGV